MAKCNMNAIVKSVSGTIQKRLPEILTGLGVIGMGSAVVLTAKAAPKAVKSINEKKKELNKEKLTVMETVEVTWKYYTPVAVTTFVSAACIIGADAVHMRRNAALAAAYTLSETTLKEYKSKVIETIGEKKEKDIRDSIAKDKLEKNPVSEVGVYITGAGNTLFYDSVSGRYFRSDISVVQKAEQMLNRQLRDEIFASYNELCYQIGLPELPVIGDELGWNVDDGWVNLEFSSQLTSDNTPCVVLDYLIGPKPNYRNIY